MHNLSGDECGKRVESRQIINLIRVVFAVRHSL